MKFDRAILHRRSIRLRGYDYSQPGKYFVTICAHGKARLFGDVIEGEMKTNEYGDIVRLYWQDSTRHYPQIRLDSFVVMPNHVHAFVEIAGSNQESQDVGAIHKPPSVGAIHELPLLAKIVGRFKMTTAKRINEIRGTPGCPAWQRNYYEHVVRNDDELSKIREYIRTNPLRWDSDPENS